MKKTLDALYDMLMENTIIKTNSSYRDKLLECAKIMAQLLEMLDEQQTELLVEFITEYLSADFELQHVIFKYGYDEGVRAQFLAETDILS